MKILTDAYKDATFFVPYAQDKSEGVYVRPVTATLQRRLQNEAAKEAGADMGLAEGYAVVKMLQAALVGWQGFFDVTGKEIPFSEQAIREICECDPEFAAALALRIRHVARMGEVDDIKN